MKVFKHKRSHFHSLSISSIERVFTSYLIRTVDISFLWNVGNKNETLIVIPFVIFTWDIYFSALLVSTIIINNYSSWTRDHISTLYDHVDKKDKKRAIRQIYSYNLVWRERIEKFIFPVRHQFMISCPASRSGYAVAPHSFTFSDPVRWQATACGNVLREATVYVPPAVSSFSSLRVHFGRNKIG